MLKCPCFRAQDEKTKKNEKLATAILNEKKKPNRLVVESSTKDDNSVIGLSQVLAHVSRANLHSKL